MSLECSRTAGHAVCCSNTPVNDLLLAHIAVTDCIFLSAGTR